MKTSQEIAVLNYSKIVELHEQAQYYECLLLAARYVHEYADTLRIEHKKRGRELQVNVEDRLMMACGINKEDAKALLKEILKIKFNGD